MRGTFANIRLKNLMRRRRGGRTSRVHLPTRRADVDLRRGDEVPGAKTSARRPRGRRVRHRLVARLGREGHDAPRRARRHREELRAHPPLEPRGHGRPAAPVRGRRGRADARPRRARRRSTSPASRRTSRRQEADGHGDGPDGKKKTFTVVCRIDTPNEVDYYQHGGILQFVLRQLAAACDATPEASRRSVGRCIINITKSQPRARASASWWRTGATVR